VTITDYSPENWSDAVHMFGHGGAMGTTAWVDTQHDLVFVYFTQSKDNDTLLELRRLVHDARVD
jgi:CubicO group peptidase (beta-lactamase class C family)